MKAANLGLRFVLEMSAILAAAYGALNYAWSESD